MRDLDVVDSELAVLSGVRRVMKADGVDPARLLWTGCSMSAWS